MSWVRWRALLPLLVVFVLLIVGAVLYLDPAVRRGVEVAGTAAVGAKVDLRSADVGLFDGSVTLSGLAVTDPAKPMTNLFELEQLVFDLEILPALEGKIIIDTLAVRGLRFGTPRATSGALPARDGKAAVDGTASVRNAVNEWKAGVRIPAISLSTLQQAVNVDAISADSLATLRAALHARAYADTARDQLLADLRALDPRPSIDSAEALANRLRTASLRTLGINGARQAVTDVRRTIRDLEALDGRLKSFQAETKANARGLTQRLEAIPAARFEDYAYAKSLLRLPTFDIPAIGPQLFSGLMAEKIGEVMYWVQMAESYVPPGLKRQMKAGPDRVRASGTDVLFPKERNYPTFLAKLAELSLAIGGEGMEAGEYSARVVGATTQPAVYGAPTRFVVNRTAGRVGPRDVRIYGSLDHRREPVRDSLTARFTGIPLPTLPLQGLGASVDLGNGVSDLQVARFGDSLAGRWLWRSTGVKWQRDTSAQPRSASQVIRLVEDAIWRAVSRLDSIEVEARFSGSVLRPQLAIRTNIANAVGTALRDQLGDEVRRAEAQVRARVDELVAAKVAEARAKADEVRTEVDERIAAERTKLDVQKKALEERLRELVRIPGIG